MKSKNENETADGLATAAGAMVLLAETLTKRFDAKKEASTKIKLAIPSLVALIASTKLSTLVAPKLECLDEDGEKGFLMSGFIQGFNGDPKHGKTTFILWRLLLAMERNPDLFAIYADMDNPLSLAQERYNRIRGQEFDDRIAYWHPVLEAPDGTIIPPPKIEDPIWIDIIKEIIKQGKKPLIVFDTLNSFLGGQNENDNSVLGLLMNKLRLMTQNGATVVVVHHRGKTPGKNSRGAEAYEGAADTIWLVESEFENNNIASTTVRVGLGRIGGLAPRTFDMVAGRYVERIEDSNTKIMTFILKHEGETKEAIEKAAKDQHIFSRLTVRRAIDEGLVAKVLMHKDNRKIYKYEKKKLKSDVEDLGMDPPLEEDMNTEVE
jgi:hypothetical protein